MLQRFEFSSARLTKHFLAFFFLRVALLRPVAEYSMALKQFVFVFSMLSSCSGVLTDPAKASHLRAGHLISATGVPNTTHLAISDAQNKRHRLSESCSKCDFPVDGHCGCNDGLDYMICVRNECRSDVQAACSVVNSMCTSVIMACTEDDATCIPA